ncbi:hypothetical protein WG70_30365 [Burkholderia oklahomensis EO147]|nr:hypothetical protein WG70_30365 [Burkholderia oklahomensis EO147]KUY49403.1 hypothetical protein WG70_20410 [Burkholderia oklahomensis EO147]
MRDVVCASRHAALDRGGASVCLERRRRTAHASRAIPVDRRAPIDRAARRAPSSSLTRRACAAGAPRLPTSRRGPLDRRRFVRGERRRPP